MKHLKDKNKSLNTESIASVASARWRQAKEIGGKVGVRMQQASKKFARESASAVDDFAEQAKKVGGKAEEKSRDVARKAGERVRETSGVVARESVAALGGVGEKAKEIGGKAGEKSRATVQKIRAFDALGRVKRVLKRVFLIFKIFLVVSLLIWAALGYAELEACHSRENSWLWPVIGGLGGLGFFLVGGVSLLGLGVGVVGSPVLPALGGAVVGDLLKQALGDCSNEQLQVIIPLSILATWIILRVTVAITKRIYKVNA